MTRIAVTAGKSDYEAFACLVREYAAWLSERMAKEAWFIEAVLKHQSLEHELATLEATYGPPRGLILLARDGEGVAGGVALRHLGAGVCEMKRMFIRDHYRGQGLGRKLCQTVIAAARDEGYRVMRLDTLPRLTEAIAMYETFGFRKCPPYHEYAADLMPHILFMEMEIGQA